MLNRLRDVNGLKNGKAKQQHIYVTGISVICIRIAPSNGQKKGSYYLM